MGRTCVGIYGQNMLKSKCLYYITILIFIIIFTIIIMMMMIISFQALLSLHTHIYIITIIITIILIIIITIIIITIIVMIIITTCVCVCGMLVFASKKTFWVPPKYACKQFLIEGKVWKELNQQFIAETDVWTIHMSRARVPIKVTLPPKTCAGTVGVRDDTSLVEMLIDPNHLDVVFLVVSTNGGTRQFMDVYFVENHI